MWVLLGVAVVVAGFAARLNPLLIVATAAVVTGVAGGLDVIATLGVLGKAFRDNVTAHGGGGKCLLLDTGFDSPCG